MTDNTTNKNDTAKTGKKRMGRGYWDMEDFGIAFSYFWDRIGGRDAKKHYNTLENNYAGRSYHNLHHIEDALMELNIVKKLAKNPDALQLAIWYHDVVYDTRAKDNEERSADFMEMHAAEAGVDDSIFKPARSLVLATKHNVLPESIDEKLIVDIDLAILGKERPIFDKYESNIRKEYAWVEEKAFREGRTKVLQMFLDRQTIYNTDLFRGRYEEKARENLKRSIDCLSV